MTEQSPSADGAARLVIATILREEGNTGVHTHVRQLRRYLGLSATMPDAPGADIVQAVITPFTWKPRLATGVFAVRLLLDKCNGPASVAWYRYWHEVFLRQGLRRYLATAGDCVIYAQEPVAARAALLARRSRRQRLVLAVHFRTSQADEWAGKGKIKTGGLVYRGIRRFERAVIPRVDGLVYVSEWARRALTGWCPEAAAIPSAVIGNFVGLHVAPVMPPQGDLVTTGHLEPVKNHRYLLDVLAAANRAGQPLTLDIFGEGPLLPELTRQARTLGLDGQVRFRGFRRDIRDFLPWYRAYVHASYSESSSLAIMEAMAAGLPAVVGDIGPLSELLEDGTEGKFWPLDDPERAAQVLLSLLADETTLLRSARAAGERFRRDFDAAAVAPKLRSFLFGQTLAVAAPSPVRISTLRIIPPV
jgi:glycosyltransferase involved in cell wall biosynthesis